jgi:hypothetical protein
VSVKHGENCEGAQTVQLYLSFGVALHPDILATTARQVKIMFVRLALYISSGDLCRKNLQGENFAIWKLVHPRAPKWIAPNDSMLLTGGILKSLARTLQRINVKGINLKVLDQKGET